MGRQKILNALGSNARRLDSRRPQVEDVDIPDRALIRSDDRGVYPISSGIPIMLAPEMLVSGEEFGAGRRFTPLDTARDPYREAYVEMDFYNTVAQSAVVNLAESALYRKLCLLAGADDFPGDAWLDGAYDILSLEECYRFLTPVRDTTVLQLGGGGTHAIRFLLAGAQESLLLTPMLSEAAFATALAHALNVGDRFQAVVGIAEQLPFKDASFDRVYSGGCIHHTITETAFPEVRRVLKVGGRFAATEPWRAPLYKLGTKILGKREQPLLGDRSTGVICRPLEPADVQPLFRTFETSKVSHHGTFTRYGLLAIAKLGLQLKPSTIHRIMKADDRLAERLSMKDYGSSVALLAEKTA